MGCRTQAERAVASHRHSGRTRRLPVQTQIMNGACARKFCVGRIARAGGSAIQSATRKTKSHEACARDQQTGVARGAAVSQTALARESHGEGVENGNGREALGGFLKMRWWCTPGLVVGSCMSMDRPRRLGPCGVSVCPGRLCPLMLPTLITR